MTSTQTVPFTLPDLPYTADALEPHVSQATMTVHHGKHHASYVDKVNDLISGTDLAEASLDQIVTSTAGNKDRQGIFNAAAQHWNHSFFWHCIAPPDSRAGTIPKALERRLVDTFGSVEKFKKDFVAQGVAQFGSGWVWLVEDGDGLSIMTTHDADTPLAHGKQALLTCDVWEHAYYLDYQNRRADFLSVFIEKLANWDFAAENATRTPAAKAAAAE